MGDGYRIAAWAKTAPANTEKRNLYLTTKTNPYVESTFVSKNLLRKRPTKCLTFWALEPSFSKRYWEIKKWQRFLPAMHQEEVCLRDEVVFFSKDPSRHFICEKRGRLPDHWYQRLILKRSSKSKKGEAFGENSPCWKMPKETIPPIITSEEAELMSSLTLPIQEVFESNPKNQSKKMMTSTFGNYNDNIKRTC